MWGFVRFGGDAEDVDRAGAGADLAQALRHRPRGESLRAARAASSGSSPRASRAASTEEWVQPDPCAAPPGWRGPGSSTSRSPSKNTSIACSRCPPVTTTARGPSAWTAGPAPRTSGSARVVQQGARLGHVRREHGGAGQQQRRSALARAAGSSSCAPDSATITGSITTGCRVGQLGQRPRDRLDRDTVAQHPDLDRVHADVARHRADLGHDDLGRDCVDRGDADVFWAVIAVIAVIPCTPHAANAFRSAWMPAPPPESEPAIESTTRDGHDHEGTSRAIDRWGYPRRYATVLAQTTRHGATVNRPPARAGHSRRARARPAPASPASALEPRARQRRRRVVALGHRRQQGTQLSRAAAGAPGAARRTPAPNRWSRTSWGPRTTPRRRPAARSVRPPGRRDPARDGADRAAELARQPGGDERPGALAGLDHDDHRGQRRDDPVAGEEHPAPDARARPSSDTTAPAGEDPPVQRRACRVGTGSRRSRAARRPSRAPASSAPACAAESIPSAIPLTTERPATPRPRPSERATSSPYGEARREPTIATGSSPRPAASSRPRPPAT